MGMEEKQERDDRDESVLAEQLQVIVVDIDRISLHSFGTKLTPVETVCATPGAKQWLEFPLLDCCTPQIKPAVIAHEVAYSLSQVRALMNKKPSGNDCRREKN